MRLEFLVDAVSVAQPRQRTRIVNTKSGKQFTQNYTPAKDKSHHAKLAIQVAFNALYLGPPAEGPMALFVDYIRPRPDSLVWKKKEMPRLWRGTKPDIDNMDKLVMDALHEKAWRNDSQVALKISRKITASGYEQPHYRIRIFSLTDAVLGWSESLWGSADEVIGFSR